MGIATRGTRMYEKVFAPGCGQEGVGKEMPAAVR